MGAFEEEVAEVDDLAAHDFTGEGEGEMRVVECLVLKPAELSVRGEGADEAATIGAGGREKNGVDVGCEEEGTRGCGEADGADEDELGNFFDGDPAEHLAFAGDQEAVAVGGDGGAGFCDVDEGHGD